MLMKKEIIILAITGIGITFLSFIRKLHVDEEVPYPAGYRNWVHVKTTVIGPKNAAYPVVGGFNHIYANDKAMDGLKTGEYTDGSVFVFDVLQAKENESNLTEGNR